MMFTARSIVVWILLFLSYSANAQELQSIIVPYKTSTLPATDLIYQGSEIDYDQALELLNRGVDISQLDPTPNDIWKPKAYPPTNLKDQSFPPENAAVKVIEVVPTDGFIARAWVEWDDGKEKHPYFIYISLYSHQAQIRNALLRTLGYPVDSGKGYRKLQLKFDSVNARKDFVDSISSSQKSDPSRWVVDQPKDQPLLTIQDVVLETSDIAVPPFHWGLMLHNFIQGRRALRGLAIAHALTEIGDSVNAFNYDVGKQISDNILLTFGDAKMWQEMTFEDAKWMARKLAKLTRADWQTIVNCGDYPPEIAALIVEKVIGRRNQMVKLFQLQKELPKEEVSLKFNPKLTQGIVKNGKVTKERIDGYAINFSFPAPDSPVSPAEIARYFGIEAISAGISEGLDLVNKQMEVGTAKDLLQSHTQDVIRDMIKEATKNPGQVPRGHIPLQTWGGPIASFNVNAGREVATGTYYSEDSPVQMVDNFSISGSVGALFGLDGIQNLPPTFLTFGANVTFQRSWSHVRPIQNLKTVYETNWTDLLVPKFMLGLANALDRPNFCNQNTLLQIDNWEAEIKKLTDKSKISELRARITSLTDDCKSRKDETLLAVSKFLESMKTGEVLVVSDTVSPSASVNATVPISGLMGLAEPLGFKDTVGVGVGNQYMVVRRTSIMKTDKGIQVYEQAMNSNAFNISWDVNFWTNLYNRTQTLKSGVAKTKAWIIPESSFKDDPDEAKKFRKSIKAVLQNNNFERLERNYSPFQLKHDLDAEITKSKFLLFRWNNLEESHLLRIKPPRDKEGKFNPDDFERSLYNFRIVRRQGENYQAFLSDVIDGFFPGHGFYKDSSGGDSANSFFGTGRTFSYSTEAELTEKSDFRPVTTIERSYAGWFLSKSGFKELIHRLESRFNEIGITEPLTLTSLKGGQKSEKTVGPRLDLVNLDNFNLMDSLQLYDISTTMIVYKEGIDKFMRALFPQGQHEAVYEWLVDLNGFEEFQEWCKTYKDVHTYSELRDHPPPGGLNRFTVNCIKPWMRNVFMLRAELPKDKTERVRWQTKLLASIEPNVALPRLLQFFGQDNYFIQLKVNGFRSGDEDAQIAPEYISNTIGTAKVKDGVGPFQELIDTWQIMGNEVYAKYFNGEGF